MDIYAKDKAISPILSTSKKQSSYIDNYDKKYDNRVCSTKTYSFYFNDNYTTSLIQIGDFLSQR